MFREGGESRDERTDVFVAVPNRSPSTTVDDPVGTVDHDRGIVRKYHLTSLVAGRERWTRVYSYVSSRVRDAYTCTHVRANLSSTLWPVPSPRGYRCTENERYITRGLYRSRLGGWY